MFGVVGENKLLGTIDSWGPLYRVSLDLIVHSHSNTTYSSVLSFKGNGASTDDDNYGDRIPIIQVGNNGYLYLISSVNGDNSYIVKIEIDLNNWYNIIIEQKLINRKVQHLRIFHLFLIRMTF